MSKYNIILDDSARELYAPVIMEMFRITPAMMALKIPRANVQQAFALDTIRELLKHKEPADCKLLCVGSFEDTCCDALIRLGYNVTEVEPNKNYDLNTYFNLPETQQNSFDIVFSVSVLEHVEKDLEFMQQCVKLIKPGGHGVFTVDYVGEAAQKPLDGNFSLYTETDLRERIVPTIESLGGKLLDEPDWKCINPDFQIYPGTTLYTYTFATLVFKKA